MVRNQLVKELISSIFNEDKDELNRILLDIITTEKKIKHYKFANEVTFLLDNYLTQKIEKDSWTEEFKLIPSDRDRDLELFKVIWSTKGLKDIILNKELEKKIKRLLKEWNIRTKLASYKIKPNKNILLYGPPGCGKTLCAHVIAGELKLPLIKIQTESLISSLLGETAVNLKKIFNSIGDEKTAIVFFDEFDVIAKSRTDIQEHGEIRRTVAILLQIIENTSSNLLVITATNLPQLLDKAIWRRFDLVIEFSKPDNDEIQKLTELKLRNYPHEKIDINEISSIEKLSHADIERACIEAIKNAIIENQKIVRIENIIYYIKEEVLRKEKIEAIK